MTDYEIARLNMVENQLRPNRIQDPRVLQAMADVPLVAGDATGYAAAVMARLAGKVHLLLPAGSEPPQAEGLREAAEVQVHTGETLRGLPELAPFDVILLTGAVDRAPQ